MAVKRWVGRAAARVDVWTITVAGTWASADTVTISVGKKDLVITLGGAASTVPANIASEIANAIMGAANATPGTGYTWSQPGRTFPEFLEFTATVNGAVVTVTGATAGNPIGLVVTEATAGDGTATESNTVPATGPEFVDNPDNYQGGALPVDNDDLYADVGATSMKYALNYFTANNIDLNIYITGDYAGQIGLPPDNATGSYAEYRQRYLGVRGGGKVLQILPGLNTVNGAGSLRLDLTGQDTVVTINAGRGTGAAPTIFLAGGHASNATGAITIAAGAVAIEPDEADSAVPIKLNTLKIGRPAQAANDCVVVIGKRCAFYTAPDITIDGGTVTMNAGASTSVITINGGTLYLDAAADYCDTLTIGAGASVFPRGASGSLGQVFCRGTLDYRQSVAGSTLNSDGDLKVYGLAAFHDPNGNETGVNLVGCTPAQVTLTLPANRKLDYSASASAT